MLTLKYVQDHRDEVIARLRVKGFDATQLVDTAIGLDSRRRALQGELDANLAEQNGLAKRIGILLREGQAEEAKAQKQKTVSLKDESRALGERLARTEEELRETLIQLPNLPHHTVPHGATPADNAILRTGGRPAVLPSGAQPHWELAKRFDLIDFELGVKITGSGFPLYKGKGAKLQRALINFFLDCNVAAGYTEVQPPIMVNEASAYGTGQLPDKEGQMYQVGLDHLYLIPTAEVPVTNIFRGQVLPASSLPLQLTAYTPCFRREAGSYGKDVRGLNRLHQFDKVEIVQIQHPDRSYQSLQEMVAHVEGILQRLELPYRVVMLCGGDMSFASALTFDFEVHSAAQDQWLEVSSVSNFESFQANRLQLRFKDEAGRNQLAHTLNGSALALPRIVAALLENNQTGAGIAIPKALQSYCGFETI